MFAVLLSTWALTLAVTLACGSDESSAAAVTIAGVQFDIDIADDPAERAQGLSGRESLASQSGMLLVYDPGGAPGIWMKGMLFPLDIVWIGDDCTVLDTTANIPTPSPGASDADLPRYRPATPTTYVLEINAGDVDRLEIQAGDPVQFSGFEVDGAGC